MNKKQQVELAVKILNTKPGYLKWGLDKLSSTFNLSTSVFASAKLKLKTDSILTNSNPIKNKRVVDKSILNIIPSNKNLDKHNVLAISDMHEPFCKSGYMEHCLKVQQDYKCGTVVMIGDEVDLCAVSQWEKDPDGFSAGTEADLAQMKMETWFKVFPEVSVCIGNHTARPFRLAKSSGLPKKFMKSYEEAWGAPKGWRWAEHHEIDGVLYTHGTGFSGPNAALRIATRHRQNTVIGHIHSEAGIQFNASKIDLIWGMQLGGALDDKTYAAFYAKDQLKKSIIGTGVVKEGKLPFYIPMNL